LWESSFLSWRPKFCSTNQRSIKPCL